MRLAVAIAAALAIGCGGGEAREIACEGQKCDHVGGDSGSADAASSGSDGGTDGICAELGTFPDTWISGGPGCGAEPTFQVHQLNADTLIIRQSLCTSFEAPFLYLLFGEDRVLLEDTGAGGVAIDALVQGLIEEREAATGADLELLVFNSHAHGDHVQGNLALAGLPDTTVVGFSKTEIASFTGMAMWPDSVGEIDLGGRTIEIFGIPGHEDNHIALYDPQHGLLLTGDTFYPGRLFIDDFADYVQSVDRMVTFAEDRAVCAILGTHIEMSHVPGDDYDFGATHHPDERELLLERRHLLELRDALDDMGAVPVREVHDDFIIFPL